MREPKIQPLAPPVRGSSKILLLLDLSHGAPLPLLVRVAADVVVLDGEDQDDVVGDQAEQDLVARAVVGLVLRLVDVGRDHGGRLHAHVVDG